MNRMDKAFKILAEKGYKTTEPRRVLLEFLDKDKNKHLSCDEIYDRLSTDHPNMGIATIYRNMQLFEELNIVTKLTLDDGVGRYEYAELREDAHQHHHLVCLNCNKLIEVKEDLLGALEVEIEQEHDFKIVDHDLKFYGYCSKCK
ncbi:MAG: Fur family transcriptional regulator [Bacillota bacterium]|nr:Fur family transcriptional regulator [Bacillota bacterium]